MRETLGKLWTAFFVAVLLFVVAVVIGTVVNMTNPGCPSCGSNVSLTVWLIGVSAHQPILWTTKTLTFSRKLSIGLAAVVVGVLTYFSLDALAASLFASGNALTALWLAVAANLIGVMAAPVASGVLVRRSSRLREAASPLAVARRTPRTWVAIGVTVWAAISLVYVHDSWPEAKIPFEESEEIRCEINGLVVNGRVSTNPYLDFLTDERKELVDQERCALHEATQLPLSIVYAHFGELREAMRKPGFTAGTLLEEALRKDAEEEAVAQHERDAQLLEDRVTTAVGGAAMFALPLAGLYATWSILPWIHRRGIWLDVALVAGASLISYGAASRYSDPDRFIVTAGVAIATSAVLARLRRHS